MIMFQLLLSKALAYNPKEGTVDVTSVEPGADLPLSAIVANVINTLASTIIYVATAVFVYGALLYILSAVREENKATGQQYMVGAIVGILIVYSAQGIFNLVIAFIYSPT